ncbi:MAG: GNAT family N-acetyltransferase [Acholeplasmatales bacterium]|nr:GNAT family N-acetyltransferase [Acholeplasmatales bacterium]
MNSELIIKPYSSSYAKTILSFTNDEESYYRWSANVLGSYPIDENKFNDRIKELKSTKLFYPYVVKHNEEVIGFFTLRYRVESVNDLTIGFVIINPKYRGQGFGKKMLDLAINLAFSKFKSDSVNLRVFKDNIEAYNCYKKCGLKENGITDTYEILGNKWLVIEMALNNNM